MEHFVTKNYWIIKKEYFDKVVVPAFSRVSESVTPVTKTYVFAGKIIVMHFYSKALAETMTRAISHNETAAEKTADLTINLWDSVSTGLSFPGPWSNPDYVFEQKTETGERQADSFMGVYLNGEETLNLYDEKNNTAYFWTDDARDLPDWISAAPVRTILHWFLSKNHVHLIHGASIGMNGQSVLLTAKGGSGKSTTALSCLMAGMDYLADDYVGIETGDTMLAHSLYSSVKITPNSLRSFPEMHDKIWNTKSMGTDVDNGKGIVFLSEFFPQQIVRQAHLAAIMIPTIKNRAETRIVPATKLQAMLALTPTTLFQLPLARSTKLGELKEIISETPCYFLELGSTIREVPGALEAFFADLR